MKSAPEIINVVEACGVCLQSESIVSISVLQMQHTADPCLPLFPFRLTSFVRDAQLCFYSF